jgi:hypothetical protein
VQKRLTRALQMRGVILAPTQRLGLPL